MPEKRIALLSINIGNYIKYWPEFYLTAKKNFLAEFDRHYFVFSDHDHIEFETENDVSLIHQENLGWPGNTLYRYHMFLGIEEQLKEYDYIYFANANLIFTKRVWVEILPEKDQKYVFVRRDRPYLINEKRQPYEDNPHSTAYVDYTSNDLYVRGGFNGGIGDAFIQMCKSIRDNIDADDKKGIVAVWHDESHITRFAIDHRNEAKILSPGYLYPQGWVMPYPKKILMRAKDNEEVRFGTKKNIISKIKKKVFRFFRNVLYRVLIIFHILPFEMN